MEARLQASTHVVAAHKAVLRGAVQDLTKISFPQALYFDADGNLAQAGIEYRLMNVTVHHGYAAKNGHYVSYNNPDGRQWVKSDDDRVILVSPAGTAPRGHHTTLQEKRLSGARTANTEVLLSDTFI